MSIRVYIDSLHKYCMCVESVTHRPFDMVLSVELSQCCCYCCCCRHRCGWQRTRRHKHTVKAGKQYSARLVATQLNSVRLTDGIKKSMRTLSTLPYHFAQHSSMWVDVVAAAASAGYYYCGLRVFCYVNIPYSYFEHNGTHTHARPSGIQHAKMKSVVPFCCSTQ